MLKLRYSRKSDKFQYVTLFGDPVAIRDLYWQLTHNYQAVDGTAIGEIKVFNTDGVDVTSMIMTEPHAYARVTSIQD